MHLLPVGAAPGGSHHHPLGCSKGSVDLQVALDGILADCPAIDQLDGGNQQFIGGKKCFRQQAAAVGGIIQRPFQQRMGGIAPCHLRHDREHPGERVHLFRLDGITLEGHGRGANLPSAKRFAQFPDGRRL